MLHALFVLRNHPELLKLAFEELKIGKKYPDTRAEKTKKGKILH